MASRPPRRRPPARRPQRRRRGGDLGARVLAALPAIVFAIFIVSQGGWIFAIGVLVLGLVCLHELYGLLEAARPVKLAGFLGLIALILTALLGGRDAQFELLLVQVALTPLVFGLAMAGPRRGPATISMAVTLFSLWWIGLAFAHAVMLRELPHGGGILVDILVGTFVGDTGAYLGGRLYGRRRLAPAISPNKTVEGLLIGMVTAVAATWFAGLYQDWLPGSSALLLGLGVALTAPLGDLFESLVKREAQTKDTGRLFGAHGGALDRLDAVFFSVVAGYYIWVALL
jgi:phosphatidate cytidylyltransferase